MKIKRSILDNLYFVIFAAFVVLFITGQFSGLTGVSLVVIDNNDPNSMFPTYFQGDLFVIVKANPDDLQVGDVIVYEKGASRIIHRIIDIDFENGQYSFIVKGDDPITNASPDQYSSGDYWIPYDAILGKVTYRIPFLGHISLAMQRNSTIQVGVYLTAILIGVAIVFWPEEEEEEEDYLEISFKSIINGLKSQIESLFQTLKSFRSGNTRIFGLILTVAIIIMLTSLSMFPIIVPQSQQSSDIMVHDATVTRETELQTSEPNNTLYFMQVSVTLVDNTPNFSKISSFEVRAFLENSNSPISFTSWDVMRSIKGEFTVGGSVIFDFDLIDGLSQDIRIEITVLVSSWFSEYTLDIFEFTHLVNLE